MFWKWNVSQICAFLALYVLKMEEHFSDVCISGSLCFENGTFLRCVLFWVGPYILKMEHFSDMWISGSLCFENGTFLRYVLFWVPMFWNGTFLRYVHFWVPIFWKWYISQIFAFLCLYVLKMEHFLDMYISRLLSFESGTFFKYVHFWVLCFENGTFLRYMHFWVPMFWKWNISEICAFQGFENKTFPYCQCDKFRIKNSISHFIIIISAKWALMITLLKAWLIIAKFLKILAHICFCFSQILA